LHVHHRQDEGADAEKNEGDAPAFHNVRVLA
jgi:hypothetical protein